MLARPELTQAQQDLLAAADYLDTHGFCQGQKYDRATGSVCIVGALSAVIGGNPRFDALFESYRGYPALDLLVYYLGKTPATWNDERGRTKDEVVQAMREAAYYKGEQDV
jgi:hypothetical protein